MPRDGGACERQRGSWASPSQPAAAPRCAQDLPVSQTPAVIWRSPCLSALHVLCGRGTARCILLPAALQGSHFTCSRTHINSACFLTGGAETSEVRDEGTEQAAPKAPPHSFLPNLQPGRQSAAARRGQVLAGPLTRASTPQSRTQVGSLPMQHSACTTPGSWERQLMLSLQALDSLCTGESRTNAVALSKQVIVFALSIIWGRAGADEGERQSRASAHASSREDA